MPGSASGKPVPAGATALHPAPSPANGAADKAKSTPTQPVKPKVDVKPKVENAKPATGGEQTP